MNYLKLYEPIDIENFNPKEYESPTYKGPPEGEGWIGIRTHSGFDKERNYMQPSSFADLNPVIGDYEFRFNSGVLWTRKVKKESTMTQRLNVYADYSKEEEIKNFNPETYDMYVGSPKGDGWIGIYSNHLNWKQREFFAEKYPRIGKYEIALASDVLWYREAPEEESTTEEKKDYFLVLMDGDEPADDGEWHTVVNTRTLKQVKDDAEKFADEYRNEYGTDDDSEVKIGVFCIQDIIGTISNKREFIAKTTGFQVKETVSEDKSDITEKSVSSSEEEVAVPKSNGYSEEGINPYGSY